MRHDREVAEDSYEPEKSRLSNQRRAISLRSLCEKLTLLRPEIKTIWLFGSRRHETRSIRSDIDLLLEIDGPPLSLEDVLAIRRIEPYLDCFVLQGSDAHSFLTESHITARTRRELLKRLMAEPIWSGSWCGDDKFDEQFILRDRSPAMSFAPAWPALEDPAEERFDGIVLTALREEFEALLDAVHDDPSCALAEDSDPGDDSVVAEVGIGAGVEPYRVVLGWVGAAGPAESAVAATSLFHNTKAPWVILCGIAAGLRGEVALGDIVVPTDMVDCDVAKLVDGHLENNPTSYTSDSGLERTSQTIASGFTASQRALEKRPKFVARDGTRAQYDRGLRVVTGRKLAAGAKVIADAEFAKQLRKIDRKICGLEMEGAGVGAAAKRLRRGQLVVKAVSDFADSAKDDRWHPYASRVAAEFVLAVIRTSVGQYPNY